MLKKIWFILPKKQRKRFFWVAVITFIGNLFEVLGVTIIVPFINAVMTPDKLGQNPIMKKIMDFFRLEGSGSLVILLSLCIILLYWVKNGYMIFMNAVQYRFTFGNRRELSNRLLKAYVEKPYLYHVEHNSGELMRNVGVDVDMFVTTVLQLVHLQTNFGMCLMLLAVLIYKDKTITLAVIGCMVIFIFIFNKALKRKTQELGQENRLVSKEMQQHMIQTFQGIKEIKVTGREEYHFREYDRLYSRMIHLNYSLQMLSVVPKPIMEALCISGLMGVIAVKVYSGVDLMYFIPTLAIFAVAAFKMFPSTAVITSGINTLAANKSAVEVIYEVLKGIDDSEKETDEAISFENEIRVEELTFQYPNTQKNVLENVNLTIEKNTSTAFIGPSGEGKSTLVDIILGLLPPGKGNIMVDGVNIRGHIRSWERQIGYIPQTIFLSDSSIRKNIAFGLLDEEIDDDKVWRAIKGAQLFDMIQGMEQGVETMIGEGGVRLSGGQRQRIGIARALYHNPQVLVLDEATSALDTETEKAIMETIHSLKGQKTLIIIAHRLSTIQNCDNIYRVQNGQVVRTTLDEKT